MGYLEKLEKLMGEGQERAGTSSPGGPAVTADDDTRRCEISEESEISRQRRVVGAPLLWNPPEIMRPLGGGQYDRDRIAFESPGQGVELQADGERLLFRPIDGLTPDELDALRRHKREIMALIRPHASLHDIPFENGGYGGLPRAQVEAALLVQDGEGICDPVLRKYNVLAWVRSYLQYRHENHGPLYEAILTEHKRLSDILAEDEASNG